MGEGLAVWLGVLVGTTVSVGARDGEGLAVTEALAFALKVGFEVNEAVAVAVKVGFDVDVNDAVAVAVKLGVGVGVNSWIPAQKPPASE